MTLYGINQIQRTMLLYFRKELIHLGCSKIDGKCLAIVHC